MPPRSTQGPHGPLATGLARRLVAAGTPRQTPAPPDGPRTDRRSQRVALLVDYPVLLRAVRAADPDAVPGLGEIVRRAAARGSLFAARAYGAWYDVEEARAAFSEGLDPVFVPPVGPARAPTTTALVADGLSLIRAGQVQALALSGDDRLLPLVAAARREGVSVWLIAHACLPDGPCARLAEVGEAAPAFARTTSRAERARRSAA